MTLSLNAGHVLQKDLPPANKHVILLLSFTVGAKTKYNLLLTFVQYFPFYFYSTFAVQYKSLNFGPLMFNNHVRDSTADVKHNPFFYRRPTVDITMSSSFSKIILILF